MAVLSREAEDVSTTVYDILRLNPPAEASIVAVQAVTSVIRYTLDGSTPSSSLGFRLIPGKKPRFVLIDDFRSIQFVRESADGSLQVTYHTGRDVTQRMDDPVPVETPTDTRAGWRTESGDPIDWIDGS